MVKWNAFLSGLCGCAMVLGVVTASAHADVTTEKGSSILVFPKVRSDTTYDTIIQIANTGNNMVHALCFYVNAALHNILTGEVCEVPGPLCQSSWQETDFTIWLTKQQPTHWLVSTGRPVEEDDFGDDGNGFDPGRIPPVPHDALDPFFGELKCIEVSDSGEPVTGNHLKGEATIKTISGHDIGDVSKYNAIGILGNPDVTPPASPPILPLDGSTYNACPSSLLLNFIPSGDDDLVANQFGIEADTTTELTLVPCSEDFENQIPGRVTVHFIVTNQFEQRFSASTTVTCFLNVLVTDLDSAIDPDLSVFSEGVLGGDAAVAEITPVKGTDPDHSVFGVLGVAERFVSVTTGTVGTARAAYNLHMVGALDPGLDQIHLTEQEQ
jgi:hypothetical protein